MKDDTTVKTTSLQVRNGSLYLDAELYRSYFQSCAAVVLLKQAAKILMMPIKQSGGGGLLIKIRNARGDRVIHAQEFFRDHGLQESPDTALIVHWNEHMAALEIEFPTP